VTIDDQRREADLQPCAGENAPAISLTNINVNFPGTNGERLEVLKNVNLTVADESIVALLGASGAGKSTLLNIIAGLVRPDSGRVCICGAPSDEQNDWCAASYMFQDERLLPWRTAIRNVEFALEAGSTPKAERVRRADAALRLVGLETFEHAFPYQLSGGMRSRVALARSLVTEPKILLMDEPFSRLDAQTRGLMHRELLRIHDLKRMTVVFVTHDVEEAALLADEVAVMSPRPGTIREMVKIVLPRPCDPVDHEVAAYIRRLRALI
jgi:NitT/TauT family transport system ATP-binding protein/sulfonate transport system ATP-binding protein